MKNALLSAVPELEWAGVNTRGFVAVISVRERSPEEPPEPAGDAGGIVAAMDGVVRSCTVLSGNPLCRPGQAVRRGELLVSGYTDYGICIRATPAKAEIYGDTLRSFTAFTPGKRENRGVETRRETKYSLVIGKKRINFYKGSGISHGSCVKMSSEKKWTLPGGFTLPVSLVTEEWVWYETETQPVPEAEAEALLTDFARSQLNQAMVAGQILRQGCAVVPDGDRYCLTGQFACLEIIGRPTGWGILEQHGKNH